MGTCCCILTGTAACQHCSNNSFATEVPTKTNVINLPNTNYTTFQKPKTPITNGDRIRGMTDEELAEFFVKNMDYICKKKGGYCDGLHCVSCAIDWLKEEAE